MNWLSLLATVIFFFHIASGNATGFSNTEAASANPEICMPKGLKIDQDGNLNLGYTSKFSLIKDLIHIGAHCNESLELVDWSGRRIAFYYDVYCFGAYPPPEILKSIEQQQATILDALKDYRVVTSPCFPVE